LCPTEWNFRLALGSEPISPTSRIRVVIEKFSQRNRLICNGASLEKR
jgi:hypothetical protein